jgi:hypothetical protein
VDNNKGKIPFHHLSLEGRDRSEGETLGIPLTLILSPKGRGD